MANPRKVALKQTITSLDNVSNFKLVTDRPTALETANEYPLVIVSVGEDNRFDYVGIPGTDRELEGVILVTLVTQLDNETLMQDFLDQLQLADDQLDGDITTFRGLSPKIYITSPLTIIDGPLVDIERELVMATCSFDYLSC